MFKHILSITLLVATISCVPVPQLLTPLPAEQYLYVPDTKIHLEPSLLKLQQPILTAPLTRIELPKEQYYYVYPNSPLAQSYQTFMLKDEPSGGNWFTENAQSLWENFSGNFQLPGYEQKPADEKPADGKDGIMMMMKKDNIMNAEDMEKMNMEKMNMEKLHMDKMHLLPASTMPLQMMDSRFYILRSQQPQFFGNYDALRMHAINPLYKLSFKTARSIEDTVVQSDVPVVVASVIPKQVVENSLLPQVSPLEPGAAVQLRSNLKVPVQSLEPVDPLQVDQVPVVAIVDPIDVQSGGGGGSAVVGVPIVGRSNEAAIIESGELAKEESSEAEPAIALLKGSDAAELSFHEESASIAQAKPSGLAIAGIGGIAQSAPTATAITGKDGLSVAAPRATAIAGDLSGDSDDSVEVEVKQFKLQH